MYSTVYVDFFSWILDPHNFAMPQIDSNQSLCHFHSIESLSCTVFICIYFSPYQLIWQISTSGQLASSLYFSFLHLSADLFHFIQFISFSSLRFCLLRLPYIFTSSGSLYYTRMLVKGLELILKGSPLCLPIISNLRSSSLSRGIVPSRQCRLEYGYQSAPVPSRLYLFDGHFPGLSNNNLMSYPVSS